MQTLTIVSSIAQTLSPLLYAVFIVVIYFQLREARSSVREVQQEFLAGGRPVVAVHDEYDHDTGALSLAVENVGQGPAKAISFSFSHPIRSSEGVEISGLPLFTIGLTSLAPGARLTCYWDDLHDQMAFLRANDLDGSDFVVHVSYCDLPGTAYRNQWAIQPAIYEGLRQPPHPEQHTHDQAGEAGDPSSSIEGDRSNGVGGNDPQTSPPEPTGAPAVTTGVGTDQT